MAPTVYKVDPDPDTVIILKHACVDFAPWISSTAEYGDVAPESPEESSDFGSSEESPPVNPPEQDLNDNLVPSDGHIASVEPEVVEVHYHVSSRHLMLGSPVFKRALERDGFQESTWNESDGLYHISASDWDAEAFLTIMQVIHGRNRQVPRTISLEMFTKIAVIEDYYQFGEALDVFRDIWLENLRETGVPKMFCREVMLWICAAWTFDAQEQFRDATMVATRHSKTSIDSLGLPIPHRVLDEIESKRYETIENIISSLHRLLGMYRDTSYVCTSDNSLSFQCGSFLLGTLTKEMNEKGLLDPRPELPFRGLNIDDLCEGLKKLRSPNWYSRGYSRYDGGGSYHSCNLQTATSRLVADVSVANEGLGLTGLKHPWIELAETFRTQT